MMRPIFLGLLILILGALSASGQTLEGTVADTYYAARGFDFDGDGQVDFVDTGQVELLAVELPDQPGIYLESNLGGMTAPMAFYPDVAREVTDEGLDILIGADTFERPQLGSALEFRTVLYSTEGTNALKAFFYNAIQAFTPKLLKITEAEELFREAVRVNPFYQDALNGLLETYYARAEGFMLVGNHYMAKAYQHKFVRDLGEEQPIVELEVEDIESALICYETGFREFMKLFNREFVGLGKVRKAHLDIDAEWLFFERRFQNPNDPYGDKVAFESLRGQKNAIGVSTRVLNDMGEEIGPVQGSPNVEEEITMNIKSAMSADSQATAYIMHDLAEISLDSNTNQWSAVDAPVKFQLPIIEGAPTFEAGDTEPFWLHFQIDADQPIQVVEMVIEFDHEKLKVPDSVGELDFTGSIFSENKIFYGPGSEYGGVKLLANQMLVRAKAQSPVSGTGMSFVKVPFLIKAGQSGEFHVYAAGSGGSLLSGYKDIAILYNLAAAHVDATAEKVRRLYNPGDEQSIENSRAFIKEEVERIGGWFEHVQALLARSATSEELAVIDKLQSAINKVSSELSSLSAFGASIGPGANVFGYPDDYVPFYNAGDIDTFDAIRNLVIGSGTFTPQTASGFFGTAREAETTAVLSYGKFQDTKDRIRSEIFTINEQAENRLVQICGRIDADGEPSLDVNNPIDYDIFASPRNTACEIGQHVLLLKQVQKQLERANADIDQFLEDIEIEKGYLQDAVKLKEQIPGIIDEYNNLQQNLEREVARVNAKQTELNSATQAASTLLSSCNAISWMNGGTFSSAVTAGIQLLNGMEQGRLERKKGELQAEKTSLAGEERIRLTEIDTELFNLTETKNIEKTVNDVVLYTISVEIAEIDVQLSLGQLNKLIMERDELLAQRGRALANLGEMSFADPSFRLTQCNTMKDAETQLEFLKRWLYLMTRTLYYKWALQDEYVIQIQGLPDVSIHDVRRLQVVGALNESITDTPLEDHITAADYVQVLLAFNDAGPIRSIISPVSINRLNSNNSARYSLREDFLHIVRTADSPEETQRVREAFRAWFTSPDRLDEEGDLVIEFDTMGHLENYNLPANETHGIWTNFALRSYASLPLWNHKITNIGVALKAVGLAFKSTVMNVAGNIQYGGAGYLKGDSDSAEDFRAYQMRQWRDLGNGRLEPVEVRTVGITIPTSATLEASEEDYMLFNLRERPVTATLWRLNILSSQLAHIEMDNIEDVYIYIYSQAYQRQ